jgi:hypothetical protein
MARGMNDWERRDFLVFEASGEPEPAYTCFFTEHRCIGHVRAEDEVAAAKAVAGVTGRVRKYAVVEATMVDLAAAGGLCPDLVSEIGGGPHRAP